MTSLGPVFLPAQLTKISHAAIAFTRNAIDDRICSHAAILYRPRRNGPLKLLDLLSDGSVRSKELRPDRFLRYAWAIPQVPSTTLQSLSWFCEEVATRSADIGYWFEYGIDTTLYDDGTTISLSGSSIGLTCSTFVLSVFQMRSVNLLNLATWHDADAARKAEDGEYQKWLFDYLRRNIPAFGLSPKVLGRIGNIPCVRYSPEDVIGACRIPQNPAEDFAPVPFDNASAAGKEVRAWTDDAMSDSPVR